MNASHTSESPEMGRSREESSCWPGRLLTEFDTLHEGRSSADARNSMSPCRLPQLTRGAVVMQMPCQSHLIRRSCWAARQTAALGRLWASRGRPPVHPRAYRQRQGPLSCRSLLLAHCRRPRRAAPCPARPPSGSSAPAPVRWLLHGATPPACSRPRSDHRRQAPPKAACRHLPVSAPS